MKETPLQKPFKDVTVFDIRQECLLVEDLMEVSKEKPSLSSVAHLIASLTVEKTLRLILYKEYKTITKIKFSVLIDKAYQKNIINSETAIQFRALKEFRNVSVHHGLMNIDQKESLMSIKEIVRQIHLLLDNFTLNEENN